MPSTNPITAEIGWKNSRNEKACWIEGVLRIGTSSGTSNQPVYRTPTKLKKDNMPKIMLVLAALNFMARN